MYVDVCVLELKLVCVHVHMETIGRLQIYSSVSSLPYFWRQRFELVDWLAWLAKDLWTSACLDIPEIIL